MKTLDWDFDRKGYAWSYVANWTAQVTAFEALKLAARIEAESVSMDGDQIQFQKQMSKREVDNIVIDCFPIEGQPEGNCYVVVFDEAMKAKVEELL